MADPAAVLLASIPGLQRSRERRAASLSSGIEGLGKVGAAAGTFAVNARKKYLEEVDRKANADLVSTLTTSGIDVDGQIEALVQVASQRQTEAGRREALELANNLGAAAEGRTRRKLGKLQVTAAEGQLGDAAHARGRLPTVEAQQDTSFAANLDATRAGTELARAQTRKLGREAAAADKPAALTPTEALKAQEDADKNESGRIMAQYRPGDTPEDLLARAGYFPLEGSRYGALRNLVNAQMREKEQDNVRNAEAAARIRGMDLDATSKNIEIETAYDKVYAHSILLDAMRYAAQPTFKTPVEKIEAARNYISGTVTQAQKDPKTGVTMVNGEVPPYVMRARGLAGSMLGDIAKAFSSDESFRLLQQQLMQSKADNEELASYLKWREADTNEQLMDPTKRRPNETDGQVYQRYLETKRQLSNGGRSEFDDAFEGR